VEPVEVELLGVARFLARRATVQIPLAEPVPLRDFVQLLANETAALVGTVFTEDGELLGGHAFTRGDEFLSHAHDNVHPGDRLALLSMVAGGSSSGVRASRPP
jgi:hypothetical protein